MISETETPLWKAARIAAGIGAIIPAAFTLLIIRNYLNVAFNWGEFLILVPATLAGLGWWFAFRGRHALSLARMRCAVIGGVALGGVAFCAGFFGPLILTPNNNLGPILGICVTGPAGFLAGFWLGVLYGFLRVKAAKPPLIPNHL